MNVLADLHHSDLYFSLHLLFERRLGWNLYRPIGEDWYNKGYWKIADPYSDPLPTVNQFLGLNRPFFPADDTEPLNMVDYIKDGIYYIRGLSSGTHHKAITFEKFCEMDIDIVIASIPEHVNPYKELIEKYKPKAKLIHQMGNDWRDIVNFEIVKNLMSSTSPMEVPSGVNAVFYHQEFDLEIFKYMEPKHRKNIYCFMNCLAETPDYGEWLNAKAGFTDYTFKSYGAQCDDGCLSPHTAIAKKMSEASFIWHLKHTGDGYGHVIHNAYACGRPTIVKKKYYRDKMAEVLLEDEVSCIDVDTSGNIRRLKSKIDYWSKDENHKAMCENAYKKFKQYVNFDEEFIKIKKFLENLV